jgi:hypothetical protein
VPEEISPREFCEQIRPKVEMEIGRFPKITVDFGIGQRYGSLIEYKGREVPDRWDEVAEAEKKASVKKLLLSIDREIKKDELEALKQLVLAHPGETAVALHCEQGDFTVTARTSLGVQDRLRWQAAVAGVSVGAYE